MGPKTVAMLELVKAAGETGITKNKLREDTKGTNSSVYSTLYSIREAGHRVDLVNGIYYYKGKGDHAQLVRPRKKTDSKASSLDKLVDAPVKPGIAPTSSFDIPRMLANKDLIEDLSRLNEQDRRDFLANAKQALFYWKSAINVLQANKSMREFAKEIGLSPNDIG